jgi:hypothetical protein
LVDYCCSCSSKHRDCGVVVTHLYINQKFNSITRHSRI